MLLLNTIFVQAKNSSGCITDLISVNVTVLELPIINLLSSNSTDNQFLFNEKISLSFNAKNYTKYRLLKDNDIVRRWLCGMNICPSMTRYNRPHGIMVKASVM